MIRFNDFFFVWPGSESLDELRACVTCQDNNDVAHTANLCYIRDMHAREIFVNIFWFACGDSRIRKAEGCGK